MTLEALGQKKLRIKNKYIRQFLAEFLGTFILLVFGVGVNAQHTLSRGAAAGPLVVYWGWGLGIGFGVWVSGGVSGGHINPAITLAMAVIGKIKVRQIPFYWVGQYLGAFAASAAIYSVYQDALQAYDGGVRQITGLNATAGIWATYPNDFLSTMGGFSDQVFGTMLLMLGIMAVTDAKNMNTPKGMTPLCVGIIFFSITLAFAWNCGFALNPARDLSPRVFTAIAGWGAKTFSHGNYWFWVPIVGPHVGALCGAIIYLVLIGFHLEDTDQDSYDVNTKPVVLRELHGHRNLEYSGSNEKTTDDSARF